MIPTLLCGVAAIVFSSTFSQELSQGIAELFSPGLDVVSFRNRTAVLLRAATGCAVVSFAELHGVSRQLTINFDPLIPGLPEALDGFGRHMAAYPCFNFDPKVNEGRPFLRGDYLSDADFYAAPIYREGFAKAGISDHAALLVQADLERVFFIGLELLEGTFQPAQREIMTLLQPHVINACHLARQQSHLEEALDDPNVFLQAGLSPRQAAVLSLMARGKSNPEIGEVLGLGLATVKSYVKAIFDKLGVDNRHAAILQAHRMVRHTSEPAPQSGKLGTAAVPSRHPPK